MVLEAVKEQSPIIYPISEVYDYENREGLQILRIQ